MIEDRTMILSTAGKIAAECWFEIPEHFRNVVLDEFVVMPNHIHGIVIITDTSQNTKNVGTDYNLSLQHNQLSQSRQLNHPKSVVQQKNPKSLSYIIATFKAAVTRRARKINESFAWQSRFYDHIIRNEQELNCIRHYIVNNPAQWELDRENKRSETYNLNHDDYFRGIYVS